MNELIKISNSVIGNEQIQTVNARELHKYLQVGRDFPTWITSRISEYNFVENQDYVVFPEMGENPPKADDRPNVTISV